MHYRRDTGVPPQATSMVNGQVLARNYSYSEGLTILREMSTRPCSIWMSRGVVASSISLYVGYGSEAREVRRLDASGSASYRDGCGNRRSSTAEDLRRKDPRGRSTARQRRGWRQRGLAIS